MVNNLSDSRQYYMIKMLPQKEKKVVAGLVGIVDDTLLPLQRMVQYDHGQRKEHLRPLFGTICFASWNGEDAALWHRVMSISGVSSILTHDERPVAITDKDLKRIYEMLDENFVYISPNDAPDYGFEINDQIDIISGPLADQRGICFGFEERLENVLVRVKFSLLGAEHVLYLPLEWCRKSVLGETRGSTLTLQTAPSGKQLSSGNRATRRGHRNFKARLARM